MILPPSLARRLFANMVSSDTSGFSASVSQDLPTHAVSKIPWRKADVKYVTNEIYFDLVESIDAIIGPNGQVIHANIFGDINSNCRLSGMPDLTLSFTKPTLLDDVSLHRCVRINRYTRERVISFVPPDGQFKLMSYRSVTHTVMNSHGAEQCRTGEM
jgi:AP-3 complex subunit mu